MNRQLLTLAAIVGLSILSSARPSLADEPIDPNSPLAPLAGFVGTWEKTFTHHKSEWVPEDKTETGVHTVQWILQNRHLQESGKDSNGTTYLTIYSFDDQAKALRMSTFQSTGRASQLTGKWNAETKTMTWSGPDPAGYRVEGTYQLVTADEFKFGYIVKKDDKTFYRLEGVGKRKAAK